MFGLKDVSIIAVYLLCILSTLACLVYGILNWNKGSYTDVEQAQVEWNKTEQSIDENL